MKRLFFLKTGIIFVLVSLLFSACDKNNSNDPDSFPEPNARGIRISCWVGANETKVELWINEYVILDANDEGSYQYGELGNMSIFYTSFSMENVDNILSSWWNIPIDKLKMRITI